MRVDEPAATLPVDAQWAVRNLGFNPTVEPRHATDAFGRQPGNGAEFAREIIDFDSEGEQGRAFAAVATRSRPLSDIEPIPWPKGLAPVPNPKLTQRDNAPLPRADVLIVTWTMDEGHALSRVLTPGFDSDRNWLPYTHNFATISKDMRRGCPALEADRLGTYWITNIGGLNALCFKSDSHMSQDGPKLPNRDVWRQIIEETHPHWVITTGTGGGIGAEVIVGDVVLSRYVRFDCQHPFMAEPFHDAEYASARDPASRYFERIATLFEPNAQFLPQTNPRPPKLITAASNTTGVVTTDFFGFDDTDNSYDLQGLGRLSEMGDAVLGLVCKEMGKSAPPYTVVRNVSDPQIKSDGLTLEQQRNLAGDIYKTFGRWSSVCSAIVCWSIVAGLVPTSSMGEIP